MYPSIYSYIYLTINLFIKLSIYPGCDSSESIQYFGADPLSEANFVSNSSGVNYEPQIFVKSADYQEKEGEYLLDSLGGITELFRPGFSKT